MGGKIRFKLSIIGNNPSFVRVVLETLTNRYFRYKSSLGIDLSRLKLKGTMIGIPNDIELVIFTIYIPIKPRGEPDVYWNYIKGSRILIIALDTEDNNYIFKFIDYLRKIKGKETRLKHILVVLNVSETKENTDELVLKTELISEKILRNLQWDYTVSFVPYVKFGNEFRESLVEAIVELLRDHLYLLLETRIKS